MQKLHQCRADISSHTDLHITTQILEGAQGLLSELKLFSRDYYLALRDNIRRCELELIIQKSMATREEKNALNNNTRSDYNLITFEEV